MDQRFKFSASLSKMALSGILLATFSCRTAEVAVNRDLQSDTEIHEVKGRQGLQIGQVISFGDFKTNKIQRGWTFAYSVPFIVKFNGAKEKISFRQFGPNGQAADVALISRFKETELKPLEDFFSVSIKYKNYFAGSVKMVESDASWDFIVHHVDGPGRSFDKNTTIGFLRSDKFQVDITGIRELEGASPALTQNDVYGYEFSINGKTIGAVSTVNNGKIWFKKGLSDELRLVLAGVSSGLMLRNRVEDNSLSMN
jgi:hypothetical protein